MPGRHDPRAAEARRRASRLPVRTGWAAAALLCLVLAGPAEAQQRATPVDCLATRPVLAVNGELERTAERLRKGEPLTILAIGSSTTAGVGTSSPATAAYPARLEVELEERLPRLAVHIEASGIGGETAVQTLERLEREVARLKPDLVVWQVGTNDALADVGEEVFRSLVERGISVATAHGADLVLLDQQFYPTIRKKDRYERFVAIVQEVGMHKKTCVFSRYKLMKAWGDQSIDELKAMLAADGFHMSDRGHACMARLLANEIVATARRVKPPMTADAAPHALAPLPR